MTPPVPDSRPVRRRTSGIVVPNAPRWHGRLAATLVFCLVRGVDATLRYRIEAPPETLECLRREPVIFAIWHNRLALSLMLYRRLVVPARPNARMAAMVSASRDGGMLARVLEWFNVEPVRGSTSRRGPQALLEMTSWAEHGLDLALTPDGPRGPRYVVQEGTVAVARVTGLPIIPVSYALGWKWTARSWDRFQVPIPFSSCQVSFGQVVRIPRESSETDLEACRQRVESELRRITRD